MHFLLHFRAADPFKSDTLNLQYLHFLNLINMKNTLHLFPSHCFFRSSHAEDKPGSVAVLEPPIHQGHNSKKNKTKAMTLI